MTVTCVGAFRFYKACTGRGIPYLSFYLLQILKAAFRGRAPVVADNCSDKQQARVRHETVGEAATVRATDAIGCLQRQIWSTGDNGYTGATTATQQDRRPWHSRRGYLRRFLKSRSAAGAAAATKINHLDCGSGGGHGAGHSLDTYPLGKKRSVIVHDPLLARRGEYAEFRVQYSVHDCQGLSSVSTPFYGRRAPGSIHCNCLTVQSQSYILASTYGC